jgi:hypothetical protein
MRMKFLILLIVLLLPAIAIPQTTQTAVFTVTWTANNTTQTGFNVERRTGMTGNFAKVGQTTASVTSYTDTIANDTGNSTFCYRVAAYNTSGQGPYSTVACATSPTVIVPPVNAPSNIAVTVSVTVTQTSSAPAPAKK